MKRMTSVLLAAVMLLSFAACGGAADAPVGGSPVVNVPVEEAYAHAVPIVLSDDMTDAPAGVTLSNDIVYYEAGHDFTYGEGSAADEHSPEEAAAHLVVTITEPGEYLLTGKLTAGQIAVDLGSDAKKDPNAVVTLIFGGADITCTVAPAVIFYNVYECGDKDNGTKDVDTSRAGANVIIADGTVNNISGAYVARIYKSVVLSDDGTEVVDSKKLHKYDGAFYSKMSMNMDGGANGNGVLNITAANEGLDSELHLTINGGVINIESGNDGINTNEDEVSVTTVNGGQLTITVNGSTGEGDGIDSNGWLVINGGTVIARGCGSSMDGGIDSDMGIHLNGGTVIATGNMMDAIAGTKGNYVVFQFAQTQKGGQSVVLKNAAGAAVMDIAPANDYRYLVFSAPELAAGDYTLWCGGKQVSGTSSSGMGMMGMGGGMRPNGGNMQLPEGMELPDGFDFGQMQGSGRGPGFESMVPFDGQGMQLPEGMDGFDFSQMPNGGGMQRPEGMELPDGFDFSQMQGGGRGQRPDGMSGVGIGNAGEVSDVFTITEGANSFMVNG